MSQGPVHTPVGKWLLTAGLAAALAGCDLAPGGRPSPVQQPATLAAQSCALTVSDPPGPYAPGAPDRSSVGKGHIVRGVVRSSVDCAPIPRAKLEMWPADINDNHHNDRRATVFTDASGAYTFESDFPNHVHMRISAPGYREIFTNAYHPTPGQPEGTFDIVLVPQNTSMLPQQPTTPEGGGIW